MAESSFGSKLLGFLNKLFQTISSPIPGFDVYDVQAKQEGDNFTSLFQFETSQVTDKEGNEITDINGNKITVNVLLKTLNAKTILDQYFTEINNIGDTNYSDEDMNNLLKILFGSSDFNEMPSYESDDTKKNGAGLLGYKFSEPNEATFDRDWREVASALTYGMECTSPGRDFGAISNITYDDIGNLVAEYLTKVNVIKSESEVNIDTACLATPVLKIIQDTLGEYWNSAVNKYLNNGDENDQGDSDNPDEANPEDTGEGNPPDNTGEGDQGNPPDTGDNNGEGDIVTSKHIDVTLQKITGTTKVKMTAIKANYGFGEVLDDIDEIINQEEFIEALPEVPTSYAVDVDDDGFDIEPCEECIECDPCESLAEVFKAGIRAYRNLYIIHWMSRGNDMMKLHLLSEDMYAELIQEIDTLGELLVEKCGSVPQLDFPCDYIAVQDYDFQTGLDIIKSFINTYIDCIDYAYCNQDSDVQSTLDEWLRYWKKQMKYFVERQEV